MRLTLIIGMATAFFCALVAGGCSGDDRDLSSTDVEPVEFADGGSGSDGTDADGGSGSDGTDADGGSGSDGTDADGGSGSDGTDADGGSGSDGTDTDGGSGSDGTDALLDLLRAAPAGAWIKVNLNEFNEVWTPLEQRPATGSYKNPARVIFAWSSMAWDSNRAQLIFWGGGHANYSGNEVYRFDVRSRRWSRASLPSDVHDPLGDSQYFAVDGPFNAPVAAHTYDNQEFLPLIDRFITFGGGKFNASNRFVLLDGSTATGPYLWDPSRAGADMVGGITGSHVDPAKYSHVLGGQMWENRNTVVQEGVGTIRPTIFWNGTSAYAPLGGKDSVFVTETPSIGGRLFRYTIHDAGEPGLDSWELIGVKGLIGYSDQGAGAYDPARGLYARTALTPDGPAIVVWNVNLPGPGNSSYNVRPLAADRTFSVSLRQGMDYDPLRNAFVLWDGGSDVWYVTPGSGPNSTSWTARRGVRTGTAAPKQTDGRLIGSGGSIIEPRGILGKWKYARAYDVFFGVEDPVRGEVWVYKPEGWSPRAAP